MRDDKEKIFELRRQGKSYREIQAILPISRGTLCCWFGKDKAFPDVLAKNKEESLCNSHDRILLMHAKRRESLDALYEKARSEARREYYELKDNPLFFTALALYWGEGDRRNRNQIRITNTDPSIIKIFVMFAERILKIERKKIKIGLLIYPDLDDNICKSYWSKELGLGLDNFRKSVKIIGRHKTNRLSYGICTAGFSSTYLKKKIPVWLEMIGQEKFT